MALIDEDGGVPDDADYTEIEAAVMETARGRWFLAEYAKRTRAADTARLMAAMDGLSAALARAETAKPDLPQDEAPAIAEPELAAKAETVAVPEVAPALATPTIIPLQPAANAAGPASLPGDPSADLRKLADKVGEVAYELREFARLDLYADALDVYSREIATLASGLTARPAVPAAAEPSAVQPIAATSRPVVTAASILADERKEVLMFVRPRATA